MTREEQIDKQANIYIGHSQDVGEDISITKMRNAFIKGAKWADKTMIDKACALLAKMVIEVTYKNLNGDISVEHYDKIEFIEDLRKAMEE